MHQIVCLYAAPIPVGHRVECRWLSEEVSGIFSGANVVTWNHEPILKDLDTGVEYSSHRAWQRAGYKVSHEPLGISDQPSPEVKVTHMLAGIVRRCRVITCAGYEGQPIQTHLDIEPTPPVEVGL